MSPNRFGRSPLGAFYRSPLGARTLPTDTPKVFTAGVNNSGYTASLTPVWRASNGVGFRGCKTINGVGVWFTKTNQNPMLCRISDGTEIWSYSFTAWAIDVDASGNCYAFNRTSLALIKLDPTGALVWTVTLPGASANYPSSLPPMIVSGSLIYIVKYVVGGPNDGNPQIHSYNTSDGSLAVSFAEDNDSQTILAMAVSPYSNDVFCTKTIYIAGLPFASVRRYTQAGSFVNSWTCFAAGTPHYLIEDAACITVDSSGYVYVGGTRPVGRSGHSVQKWAEDGTYVTGVALDTRVTGFALTSAQDKLVLSARRYLAFGPDVDRVMILSTSDLSTLNDTSLSTIPNASPNSVCTLL